MWGKRWLVDTNILIRWIKTQDPAYPAIRAATDRIGDLGGVLCFTPQNIGEFWNVLTRPVEQNGYGESPSQTHQLALAIEKRFQLLPEIPEIYHVWRRLLVAQSVSGVQVHDARLVASMTVHNVRNILTFNTRDFARFTGVQATHPSEITEP